MSKDLVIAIVEDNPTNLQLMQMLVGGIGGTRAIAFQSSRMFCESLAHIDFSIAIVDYQMPELNGVDVIRAIRADGRHAEKPIVMVTADREAGIRMQALEAGAVEFLNKPIDAVEFKARMRNLLKLCDVQRKLADRAEWLRAEVDEATLELRRREEEIIDRLAIAAGYKDRETAAHTARMARYCGLIAASLGLDPQECRDIQLAAPMHDIGKVGIRDDVLLKQGPLDESETQHMRSHTAIGAAILGESGCELLHIASTIARSHHEHWDGSGYPNGLAGEAIPLPGRIAAVADVFDALTTERPYKAAWSVEDAVRHLRNESGRHFDPRCVAAFERSLEEVGTVMAEFTDRPGERRAA